ncbi:hypothetical protein SAMN05216463_12356 [Xylanibacter ruminicola]|uniref:Uncharacterized protein n=2 Tax=Xylanibacter ruminicola TaxID=839 RepID=A0A1M6Y1K7_XYLRU|nr:hypothetical protein SAMN05216463_12356 [Xylanibacter ruminicola]
MNDNPGNNVEYYVKYHWLTNGIINGHAHFCIYDIKYVSSISSTNRPITNTINYSYPSTKKHQIEDEVICGPFKKSDKVSIEIFNEKSDFSRLLEIYVSKNNSPFALKCSTDANKLDYVIND